MLKLGSAWRKLEWQWWKPSRRSVVLWRQRQGWNFAVIRAASKIFLLLACLHSGCSGCSAPEKAVLGLQFKEIVGLQRVSLCFQRLRQIFALRRSGWRNCRKMSWRNSLMKSTPTEKPQGPAKKKIEAVARDEAAWSCVDCQSLIKSAWLPWQWRCTCLWDR